VREVMGEDVGMDDLGGPAVHARNGVSHLDARTDAEAVDLAGDLLDHLPQNSRAAFTPTVGHDPLVGDIGAIVPAEARKVYDVRDVLRAIVDGGRVLELNARWARNVVTAYARIDGRAVGVVANQPKFRGGVLDADAIVKATRFVELCEGFGLPLIVLQDLPGVMIGLEAERLGVAQKLIALYTAIARSTVPKVTVILRKAFGFGYMALAGPNMGTDYVVAWANAEIGFMSADNAVHVVHHKRIKAALEQDGEAAAQELARVLEIEMHNAFAPWTAATQSHIHDVIAPEETRQAVIDGLFVGSGYR
jgi:acetyl-CoA carboxylase carboxyltransferase component